MTKYARVIDNIAIDVIEGSPEELFHTDLAVQFIEVPDDVQNGYVLNGKAWEPPAALPEPEPVEQPKPPLSKARFLEALTREERLAIRGARTTDPIADDFLLMLDETGIADLVSADGEAALTHFVTQGYLTDERVVALQAL